MKPLRIAYCSDLHLEFDTSSKINATRKLIQHGITNQVNADVLILAGDIVPASLLVGGEFDTFFDITANQFNSIIWVFGNHEYYGGFLEGALETAKNYVKRWKNIHILEKNAIEIDGISFFGSTLWTDMKKEDFLIFFAAKSVMSDYKAIKRNQELPLTSDDTVREHKESLRALKTHLDTNKPTVVVTHHAPSFGSIAEKYQDSDTSYYYYSDLDYLAYDYPNILAWVHGHVHDNFEYLINNTNVLCNPRGYIGYEAIADTFGLKYFDIQVN